MPYLAGRMDRAWEMTPGTRNAIAEPPSSYLKRIDYDAACYRQEAPKLCIEVGGADKVMYGSDYPHDIGDMKGCRARVEACPRSSRPLSISKTRSGFSSSEWTLLAQEKGPVPPDLV